MVFLSAIKGCGRHNLGNNWLAETRLPTFAGSAGRALLLGTVEENGRAILRAEIRTLAVGRGGIVHLPEMVEQLVIGNFAGIEGDLDGFGVAGAVGTHILVGGIGQTAAGIAHRRIRNSRQGTEGSLYSPETTGGESGVFHDEFSSNRF